MEEIIQVNDIGSIDMAKPGHNVVYGKNDEGKSTIMSKPLDEVENQRIAIIDFHNEYTKLADKPNVDRFIPTPTEKNNDAQTLDFLRWALTRIKKLRYDVIVIDEFNQYVHNNKHETPYELEDLKNNVAHEDWGGATSFLIMRLPAQGDSEFRETSNYMIIAGLQGKNGVKQLNDSITGLGDAAKRVVGTNHFVVKYPSGYFAIHDPVEEKYTTAKR